MLFFSISSMNSLLYVSVERRHTSTDTHTCMYIWEAGDMSVVGGCVHINKRKSADKHACEVSFLLKEGG